jgi:hypothetical protein
MEKHIDKCVEETSRLWKMPERDVYAGSILIGKQRTGKQYSPYRKLPLSGPNPAR